MLEGAYIQPGKKTQGRLRISTFLSFSFPESTGNHSHAISKEATKLSSIKIILVRVRRNHQRHTLSVQHTFNTVQVSSAMVGNAQHTQGTTMHHLH